MEILDNSKKFIVLGFIKCGQNSMLNYLGCKKNEIAWRDDAITIYKQQYEAYNLTPVFILRHPVDRCWSHYWYFKNNEKMSYEEFLDTDMNNTHGTLNPIEMCDYYKFIEPFCDYKPIVVKLEEMRLLYNFPKENVRYNIPIT